MKTEVHKLSALANKVTRFVRRDYLFVAVVKSVVDLSATLEKEHGVSFHAAAMMDVVEIVVLFNFLTINSSQTYQHNTHVAKFLLLRPIIHNVTEDNGGEKRVARMLGISLLSDGTLFSSWTVNGRLLDRATSEFVRNKMKQLAFYALPFFQELRKSSSQTTWPLQGTRLS